MAVRNWWAQAHVDGRKSLVTFGPKGKDGGFLLKIFQRSEGKSFLACRIEGSSDGENLILSVDTFNEKGECIGGKLVRTRR